MSRPLPGITPPAAAEPAEPGAAPAGNETQAKLPEAKKPVADDLQETVAKMVADELAKVGKKKRF